MRLPETGLSAPGQTFGAAALVRSVGAALVALAMSSLLGYHAPSWNRVALLVELEVCFASRALSAWFSRVFFQKAFPPFGWLVAGILGLLAAARVPAWRRS